LGARIVVVVVIISIIELFVARFGSWELGMT
jgi:hypothetical protein